MSDWLPDIIRQHNLDHEDAPDSIRLGKPATVEAIRAFEQSSGRTLPAEFHELYQEVDGYGCETRDGLFWFFVPLEVLPVFVNDVRNWIGKTHPTLAARFLPFVDWGNGDACGYLFSESGEREPGIYMFNHEDYDHEEGQDGSDFLVALDEDLREFLNN